MTKNSKAAPAAPQSKYAGIGAARAQRPANYFKPGFHGLVRILKVEEGEDRFKTTLVACQATVVHLFADADAANTNKVGEECAEVIKKTNQAYAGRLKALAMAVGDLTEQDFEEQKYDGEIFDELLSEDQPAAGVIVETRSALVKKKAAAEKTAEQLKPSDFYTRVDFLRRVPFGEVKEILAAAGVEERIINQRVPNIDAEIAQEQTENEASES